MWKWNSFFVMHIKTKQTKGNFDYLQYIIIHTNALIISCYHIDVNRSIEPVKLLSSVHK